VNSEKEATSIYSNIQWNLGAMAGMAAIIRKPDLINLSEAPLRMKVDGLDLDALQCFGVALLEKDRQPRADELIAMAKRALLAEATEMAADFLVRAVRIVHNGKDPYEIDDYFSVSMNELWNPNSGKAGSLLTEADRNFFENCAAPLRHLTRHNNARLLPKKEVNYTGNPRGKQISINLEWEEGVDNNVTLSLSVAHDIFLTTREAVKSGLQDAYSRVNDSAA
jgi:hypothetical protein